MLRFRNRVFEIIDIAIIRCNKRWSIIVFPYERLGRIDSRVKEKRTVLFVLTLSVG